MERRKKGSGQITRVEGRKSPWRASVVDSSGKQKSRFFKTEKEAKAFLREINADANKLKTLLETGVSFRAFTSIFLDEKAKQNMKPTAYHTLSDSVERVNGYIGNVMLRDIDSDMVQQMIYDLARQGYSESIMSKAKMVVGSILKMAAAKHYLEAVPVLDITIPTAKNQDIEKQAKNNWIGTMRFAPTRKNAEEPTPHRNIPSMPAKNCWCTPGAISCCSFSTLACAWGKHWP